MTTVIGVSPPKSSEVKVGIVDCDTHNYFQSPLELFPFLSLRWQEYMTTFGIRDYTGAVYPRFWGDPPDYAPPSGRKAGADVAFMGTDHLDRFNVAYAILIPSASVTSMSNLEFSSAIATAINDWQVAEWLEKEPRLRASIVVTTEDPLAAVAEIRRAAIDKRFVQVQFGGRPPEPMGRRRYWPIYEVCAELGLPIMSHAFGSTGQPITGAGWPSFYIEDHISPPQSVQANITSLVMEGVFEHFPTLKFVSVENGFGWVPSLVWRMDNAYRLLRNEVPHLSRFPSEYVQEHVYFATQPAEETEKREYFPQLFEQYPAFSDHLMFSSDYPHWDGDTPARALPLLRDQGLRDNVLRQNARQLYDLS